MIPKNVDNSIRQNMFKKLENYVTMGFELKQNDSK